MILIMGLAGSGKGTQGQLLADKLNYKYLSTGEFLRTYITEERKKEMAAGKLINDEEIIGIIRQFLDETDAKDKTILDGFPRSKGQADWLYEQHQAGEINIEAVVYLEVPEEELINRLLKRARHDDTEEAIIKRFDEYSTSTSPIIEDYKSKGINILKVDGTGNIEEIQSEIMASLREINPER